MLSLPQILYSHNSRGPDLFFYRIAFLLSQRRMEGWGWAAEDAGSIEAENLRDELVSRAGAL